jgi:predicted nucleotidyltransferase
VDRVEQIVDRARDWAIRDTRVRGALVHGSAARGDTTPLSDVDLIVVAEPGQREAIWADRSAISRDLLGSEIAEAHEVPHQRPFRWQARTADLRMLDLTLDEGSIEMWSGLRGEVEFLVDRADLARDRESWIAAYEPLRYDTLGQDDETWAILSWLAGALLHGRVWQVRWGITDLIGRRILPVTDEPSYALGAFPADGPLIRRLDATIPRSLDRAELARALQEVAKLYEQLVTEWAGRAGVEAPRSPFAPAVRDALRRLVEGKGERLA